MGAAAVIISGGLRLNLFPAIFRATVEILIKHERSLAQEAVAIFARMRSTFGDRASHEALMATLNSMRSEEHTSELQSLMRISYAVFCLKTKTINIETHLTTQTTPPNYKRHLHQN